MMTAFTMPRNKQRPRVLLGSRSHSILQELSFKLAVLGVCECTAGMRWHVILLAATCARENENAEQGPAHLVQIPSRSPPCVLLLLGAAQQRSPAGDPINDSQALGGLLVCY